MNKAVAVVGMCGSGKSVLCNYFCQLGWESVYFGGVTGSQLKKDGIEVTFYSTMGKNLEEVTNRYTKEFNKIYPDIKIKHVVISGDYNVLYDRI